MKDLNTENYNTLIKIKDINRVEIYPVLIDWKN